MSDALAYNSFFQANDLVNLACDAYTFPVSDFASNFYVKGGHEERGQKAQKFLRGRQKAAIVSYELQREGKRNVVFGLIAHRSLLDISEQDLETHFKPFLSSTLRKKVTSGELSDPVRLEDFVFLPSSFLEPLGIQSKINRVLEAKLNQGQKDLKCRYLAWLDRIEGNDDLISKARESGHSQNGLDLLDNEHAYNINIDPNTLIPERVREVQFESTIILDPENFRIFKNAFNYTADQASLRNQWMAAELKNVGTIFVSADEDLIKGTEETVPAVSLKVFSEMAANKGTTISTSRVQLDNDIEVLVTTNQGAVVHLNNSQRMLEEAEAERQAGIAALAHLMA